MKNTAPISSGIIAIAAAFGVIAAGVAYVLFDFGGFGALFVGVIFAVITAILLMLGWREPVSLGDETSAQQAAPMAADLEPAPVIAPETTPAKPEVVEVKAPDSEVATPPVAVETAPTEAVVSEPDPTPVPVEKTPVPKAEPAKVKPSAALPGEAALSEKKGEWKYDGPGAEADSAPSPKAKAPVVEAPVVEAPLAEAASADAGKPQFLSAAREGGPDDLKQIKGVGPKLETTLHGMGIYHFDQISNWGPAEQAWMDDNLAGFKGRASRDNWVEQAKILAAGGTTEFSGKVKKGGVY